jgi:prepilin-type processing-associated H-X9-DG protein
MGYIRQGNASTNNRRRRFLKLMAHGRFNKKIEAFTLVELFMVVFLVAVFSALLLVTLPQSKRHQQRISCVGSLKNLGLSFRIWATGHSDQYPMLVSTNQGGSLEFVGSGQTFRHFQVMCNELSASAILICPSDRQRKATNFQSLSNGNLSYFAGIDASTRTNPQMFLAGDHNITNATKPRNGILELTANAPAGWTHTLHRGAGNIALADGSVQQLTIARLREQIAASGVITNRLAVP